MIWNIITAISTTIGAIVYIILRWDRLIQFFKDRYQRYMDTGVTKITGTGQEIHTSRRRHKEHNEKLKRQMVS
jgi:hypothetical protein